MFFIRALLVMIWVGLSSLTMIAICPFHFGDLTLNRRMGRMLSYGILRITGISVVSEGVEKLRAHQPCIYVANHQSMFDIASFSTIFPDGAVIIGKRELVWMPLFGIFFIAAGNIPIDRQKRNRAVASLARVVARIRERKLSVWVFPEGTRNRTPLKTPLLPFKKGAFHMAVQAGIPVIPVISSPLAHVYSWEERRLNPGELRLKVLDPISTKGFGPDESDRLAALVREKMLEGIASFQNLAGQSPAGQS